MDPSPPQQNLSAVAVAQWARTCATSLSNRKVEINSLNVFPVPDSDTGSNMAFTMASAVANLDHVLAENNQTPADLTPAEVASALAAGAARGARGNSGVVLSQLLRGLADSASKRSLDGCAIRDSLHQGFHFVQAAIADPVEGTVITVLRSAAVAADAMCAQALNQGKSPAVADVTRASRRAAALALARTPSQLPALRKAGVVDAGGQGLLVLLEELDEQLHPDEPLDRFVMPYHSGAAWTGHYGSEGQAWVYGASEASGASGATGATGPAHPLEPGKESNSAEATGSVDGSSKLAERTDSTGQTGLSGLPGSTESTLPTESAESAELFDPADPADPIDHAATSTFAPSTQDHGSAQDGAHAGTSGTNQQLSAGLENAPAASGGCPDNRTPSPAAGHPDLEVMYFIEGADIPALRSYLTTMGDSIVIGPVNDTAARVHIHTDRAGEVIEHAFAHGRISSLHVEALREAPVRRMRVVLALAPSRAVAEFFGRAGAETFVVDKSLTVDDDDARTVQDIVAKLGELNVSEVLLLTNGLIPRETARTIALNSTDRCTVIPVPAITVAAGTAAMAVHDPSQSLVDDAAAMAEAAQDCSSVVVSAEGPTILRPHGQWGAARQTIDMPEYDPIAVGITGVRELLAEAGELVTIIVATEELRRRVEETIAACQDQHSVEFSVFTVAGIDADAVIGVE